MRVHDAVLAFMAMPYTIGNNAADDAKMQTLLEKAHTFLRSFCLRHDANQRELYACLRVPTASDSAGVSTRAPHTDGCLVVDSVDDVHTVGRIFAGNVYLCEHGVRADLVDKIVEVCGVAVISTIYLRNS
jgi:hypothetical protein